MKTAREFQKDEKKIEHLKKEGMLLKKGGGQKKERKSKPLTQKERAFVEE